MIKRVVFIIKIFSLWLIFLGIIPSNQSIDASLRKKVVILQYLPGFNPFIVQQNDIDLQQFSWMNAYSYARYHGYDYKLIETNASYVKEEVGLDVSWIKMFAIYHFLRHSDYDFIVYVDPTNYILNTQKPLENILNEWNPLAMFYIGSSLASFQVELSTKTPYLQEGSYSFLNSVNTGIQIWRRTRYSIELIEKWLIMLKRSIDFDLFRQNPPYEAMIFHVYVKPKLETEKEGEVYYIPLTSPLEFKGSNFPFIVETPWSDMREGISQSTGMAQIVILQSWTQNHLALIHLLNNSLSNDNKFVLTEQHYQFYTEKSYNYLDIDFRKIHPKLIENHHPSPFLIRISENQFIDESMVDICTLQTKDREICQDAYEYANEKQMALFRQYYEQIEYEALQFYEHLKDQCGFYPHSVLDIGANRGLWSGRMRKYFFPEAHYFLVEGNEECIDFYQEKKLPYPYEQTLIGNYTGKITFYTNPNDKYAGGNSIFRETSIEFSSYFKPSITNITTIDELMHRRKIPTPINLLKFDIQGGEYDGLLGGKETLKSVEVIQTECPIVNYNEGSATFLELHTLLKSYDFDLFQIMQTLTDGRSVGIQFDAIWVKRSSQLWNESCTSSKPMNMLSKETERWLSTFRNRYDRN